MSARDALRVAVPLLAGRVVAPFVARWVPLPRALAHARIVEEAPVDPEIAAEVIKGVEGLLRIFRAARAPV